jgi:hypothetical protein
VWCSQEVLSSPSINVDVSRLESLFSMSPDKKASKFTPKSGKEAKQSPLVSILTLPRLNNIGTHRFLCYLIYLLFINIYLLIM